MSRTRAAKDTEAKRKELFSLLDSTNDTANTTTVQHGDEQEASNSHARLLDEINFDFEGLEDLDDIDLTQIDDDIKLFQQDPILQKAIQEGIDLRAYSRDVEANLQQVEVQSIQDYIREGDRVAKLHTQLKQCDRVLEKMEDMLRTFQGSLGTISEEIKTLQDKSFSMNITLKNCQSAERDLAQFVEQLVVPPLVITEVCESEVNEAYLEYLALMNQKVDVIQSLTADTGTKPSCVQDTEPTLQKLIQKAVFKLRAFLLQKIADLKKPKTNTQFLKQNVLLKFKHFQAFLERHHVEVANEVRLTYVDTMCRYYYQSFKTYIFQLQKIEQKVVTSRDLIVEPQGSSFSFFGAGNTKAKRTVFQLLDRDKILASMSNMTLAPIVPYMAIEKNEKYSFEALFKSIHALLINTATAEYVFIIDFFQLNEDQSDKLFHQIFRKTMIAIQQYVDTFLNVSFDCIAVLLMVQVLQGFRNVMQQRKIAALDSYFDELISKLWPRFKLIFEKNLESIQIAIPQSLVGTEKVSPVIARRYAELAGSIAALNKDPTYKNNLEQNLNTLRNNIEKLLNQIGQLLASESPKLKLVYLINSYDAVITTISLSANADRKRFQKLIEDVKRSYIDVELREWFDKFITFVSKIEPQLGVDDASKRPIVTTKEMEELGKDFEGNWKNGLMQIHGSVTRNFSSLQIGKEIMREVMTRTLVYYNLFTKIVSTFYPSTPQRANLLNDQRIMVEFKKLTRELL